MHRNERVLDSRFRLTDIVRCEHTPRSLKVFGSNGSDRPGERPLNGNSPGAAGRIPAEPDSDFRIDWLNLQPQQDMDRHASGCSRR